MQCQFAGFVGTCIFILAASSAALLGLIALFSRALTGITGIPEHWLAAAVLMGTGQLLCSIGLAIWQVRGLPAIYGAFLIGVSLFNALLSVALVVWMEMGWQGRVIGQVAAVFVMGMMATALLARGEWIRFRFSRDHARGALRAGDRRIAATDFSCHLGDGAARLIDMDWLHVFKIGQTGGSR